MKVICTCGNVLTDSTDGIPYKGYFMADQDWFAFLDRVDSAIESNHRNREKVIYELRAYIVHVLGRNIYQCPECGRLYMDDVKHQLHEFVPVGPLDHCLLKSNLKQKED